MTKSSVALALALGTTGALSGCDVEPDSALAYDTVARVELDALQASSWGKEMLGTGNIDVDVDGSDACGTFVKSAKTLTVGTGSDRIEVYVEGKLDADAAEDCADTLEKELSAKKPDDGEKPQVLRAELVADGVFAFVVGPAPLPRPSRARLKDLLDADPSPDGKPMWFTTRPGSKSKELQYAEGWMDPAKGLDAHVSVEFTGEALAAKSGAEATMFLTMLRMSDEMSDVAKSIELKTSGNTITAEVHATEKTMKKLVAQSSGDHKPHAKIREHRGKHSKNGKQESGISFSFSTDED